VAARFGACACRSGSRRGLFLADLVGQIRSSRLLPTRQSRASLRTRYDAPWPAWKVARLRERSARRRVWVRGSHTGASGHERAVSVSLSVIQAFHADERMPHGGTSIQRTVFASDAGLSFGYCPERWWLPLALEIGPSVGLGLIPGVSVCAPGTHTRRRADRSRNLATFHAGPAAPYRVRRDARDGRAGDKRQGPVSPTRSARKRPRLGPDRHAQAPKRAATGLPPRNQTVTHRRRPGSEGHFLRTKRLCREQEVTLASGAPPAHGPSSDPRFRGVDGAVTATASELLRPCPESEASVRAGCRGSRP